jgi:hypothetical protein
MNGNATMNRSNIVNSATKRVQSFNSMTVAHNRESSKQARFSTLTLYRRTMRPFLLVLALLAGAGLSLAQGDKCSNNAKITITTSGTVVIIPAQLGINIRVCLVSFSTSATTNITLVATNASGNTNLTGVYAGVGSFNVNFLRDLQTGTSNGFAITSSAAITGGGYMTYEATQ